MSEEAPQLLRGSCEIRIVTLPREHAVTIRFDMIVFQVQGGWVAQGIQHDVNAQGQTKEEAVEEMQRLAAGHVLIRRELGLPPFEVGVAPAPSVYQRAFQGAKTASGNAESQHIHLPDAQVAEFRESAHAQ